MDTKDISVVFFGSGPVAARSLELLARNFTIEAVVTKPRPAHHKGDVPVLDLCASDTPPADTVLTVSNKRELSELFAGTKFKSRVGVVIDFGIIISQDVIDAFPLGIINSHFSLLPEWRGADPITFSILSGQKQTGVSLMAIDAGLDTGRLLTFGVYDMDGTETTPYLSDYLVKLSDALLLKCLPQYVAGTLHASITQERAAATLGRSAEPTYSRKLTKEDGILDFSKPAVQLEREIRAYAGWPKSRTTIGDKEIVITAAHVVPAAAVGNTDDSPIVAADTSPGSLWRSGKKFGFYTSEGILAIDKLKPAGKQEMTAEAFIAGYRL
ncbi:MAG TPA: methionyl-tRNA formyltransferase [Candidatus Saccharimonadales bacterium]|jgi:methionyl-tRNA formyltransferase